MSTRSDNKLLFALHGWSGFTLGILLYTVILTGAIALFEDEIGTWSSPPSQSLSHPLPANLDHRIREIAAKIDPRYVDDIAVFTGAGEKLSLLFHTHSVNDKGHAEDEGIAVLLDPASLKVLEQHEARGDALFESFESSALSRFLVNLHVRLYVPEPWGLILTGILGLSMMVAAITGIILHRQMIRNLFVLRRRADNPLLTRKDRHVLAGTWNLLFAFLLAFTGSFFSFAESFGLPVLSMVSFEGDEGKLMSTLVGEIAVTDEEPAVMHNLDYFLSDAKSRANGASPQVLSIQHWGTGGATVLVNTEPAEGNLSARSFVYRASTGEFIAEKPSLGTQPSIGSALFSSLGPLHFGTFLGTWSKIAWFLLGLASAYVVVSGLSLWAERRKKQQERQSMSMWIDCIAHGLPLSLIVSGIAYFLATMSASPAETWVKTSFTVCFLGLALITFAFRNQFKLPHYRRSLMLGNAALLLLLPLVRWQATGLSWSQAFEVELITVVVADVLFVVIGAAFLTQALRKASHE